MSWTRISALACLVLGVAATAWAATELRGGIAELPNHWWSAAALAFLAFAAAATLVAWRLPRPTTSRLR